MPIYEYQCESCDKRTEAIQKLDEPPLTICPHCGGALRKLMSAPSFQFKGTGWYVTDYASKKGGKEGRGGASDGDGGKKEGVTSKKAADSSSGKAGSSDKGDSSGSAPSS